MTRRLALLLLAAAAAGCSAMQAYPERKDKNLSIRTRADSGSPLSTVRAGLHIHRVNAKCEAEYVGSVLLNETLIGVGIPPGELTYLVLRFENSSLLGNSSSTMTYDTLVRPRAGHRYDMKVSYVDDFYAVEIREIDPRRSSAREVPRLSLRACRSI